jgi:hypothetical protein
MHPALTTQNDSNVMGTKQQETPDLNPLDRRPHGDSCHIPLSKIALFTHGPQGEVVLGVHTPCPQTQARLITTELHTGSNSANTPTRNVQFEVKLLDKRAFQSVDGIQGVLRVHD